MDFQLVKISGPVDKFNKVCIGPPREAFLSAPRFLQYTHYTVTLPVIRVSTAVHIQTSDKCLRSLEVRQASVEGGGDPLLHLLTLWELDF